MIASFALLASALTAAPQELPNHKAAAARTLKIIDLVVAKHIDPPTRAELVRQVCRATVPRSVSGLGRQLSEKNGKADLLAALETASRAPNSIGLSAGLQEGLGAIWGPVMLTPAADERINKQVAENRYVGTGIQLAMKPKPVMQKVFEDGPAHKVGALDGDIIDSIEGVSTDGKSIRDIVTALRGPKGSPVRVTLRQPGGKPREYTIVRGVVPIRSVSKLRWTEDREIVHLGVTNITASTAHELRKAASEFPEQTRHVVLDFRQLSNRNLHHGQLVADALLDEKPLGSVTSADGKNPLKSEPGELFDGLQLTVVVDKSTTGTAEWIAAALQDHGRAIVAGNGTALSPFVNESVPAPDNIVITLPVGMLKRINDQPIEARRSPAVINTPTAVPTDRKRETRGTFEPLIAKNFEIAPGEPLTLSETELKELDRQTRRIRPHTPGSPENNSKPGVGE